MDNNALYVDAIEDGKIVRVTERYAKQEGLFVLKREAPVPIPMKLSESDSKEDPFRRKSKTPLDLDRYRRPLNYKKSNLISDMAENFHWDIIKSRKLRNMTRRSLAAAVGATEEDIKKLENGILPSEDYILVSKIEKYFGISLRKDKKDFHKLPMAPGNREEAQVKEEPPILEDSIDLSLDEDISK